MGSQSIQANRLFGRFFEADAPLEGGSEHVERRWEWPKEMGCGSMSMIQLRPGLSLGIGCYRLLSNLSFSFEIETSPFTIAFSRAGNIRQRITYEHGELDVWHLQAGHGIMSYLPLWQGVTYPPSGVSLEGVMLYVDPSLLMSLTGPEAESLPRECHDIIRGDDHTHFYRRFPLSPHTAATVNRILDLGPEEPFRLVTLQASALELIRDSLQALLPDACPLSPPCPLTDRELKRVRMAHTLLTQNLESPPSLPELARSVGTNKNKLNHGFRELYCKSVYDCLRIHRLEKATQLLETGQMSITQVALEVGYAQHSNFTKAFKKHFGISPSGLFR